MGGLSQCCRTAGAAALWSGVFDLGLVFDGDLAEAEAAGLAQRTEADAEYESQEFADVGEVDGELAQQRGVVPDVAERQAGELASPAECHRDAAETTQNLIAAEKTAREALIAASPHAIN